MKIVGYRKSFGGTVRMREVFIEDFHLRINPIGIAFIQDVEGCLPNVSELEELSDEHLSPSYIDLLIAGVTHGTFCARELQSMFGIEPEDKGSILMLNKEHESSQSPIPEL